MVSYGTQIGFVAREIVYLDLNEVNASAFPVILLPHRKSRSISASRRECSNLNSRDSLTCAADAQICRITGVEQMMSGQDSTVARMSIFAVTSISFIISYIIAPLGLAKVACLRSIP